MVGTYRTSNNGGMWHHVIENMPDGSGRVVARCEKEEDAERIVREHNAHDGLVDVLKSLRDAPYGLKMLPKLSEHACAGTIRDTWMPRINAALALVEGKADG